MPETEKAFRTRWEAIARTADASQPIARQGRFSFVVGKARMLGLISRDTAIAHLDRPPVEVDAFLDGLRPVFL